MAKNTTMEELKMISLTKEKGISGSGRDRRGAVPDLVGAEPIEDMLMLFEETDIQILEGAPRGRSQGEDWKRTVGKKRRKRNCAGDRRWGSRPVIR